METNDFASKFRNVSEDAFQNHTVTYDGWKYDLLDINTHADFPALFRVMCSKHTLKRARDEAWATYQGCETDLERLAVTVSDPVQFQQGVHLISKKQKVHENSTAAVDHAVVTEAETPATTTSEVGPSPVDQAIITNECRVCMERQANCILPKCGHKICDSCTHRIRPRNRWGIRCPYCRRCSRPQLSDTLQPLW